MKIIKKQHLSILIMLFLILLSIGSVNAIDNNSTLDNSNSQAPENNSLILQDNDNSPTDDFDLESKINNAKEGDEILIEPGTYYLHNINLTKDISLIGNGNSKDIIIDGENKSSIFLIRSDAVHVTFKNITFINAKVTGFGGAISMETGHVYVDTCNFINNTASVNAGGISNYGNENVRGYLFVNNSLFVNNHAGHDGGAITTCYASSDIYNCVFIGNTAVRDGGAIRVSVAGYGNVQDCIFMYNHADEWGGAYYSWAGESNIERCIFMNNTAGTNGGAIMVSGDLNLQNSVIVNNYAGETGGSFYIQQPMYDARTVINVHDNLITNNSSPYGKEIFIKWEDTKHLFTKFNNNDWGDEDPNDPTVIDPDKVTTRSKVTTTIKSDLMDVLNLGLLTQHSNFTEEYFPEDFIDSIQKKLDEFNNNSNDTHENNNTQNSENTDASNGMNPQNKIKTNSSNENTYIKSNITNTNVNEETFNEQIIIRNSTSHGEDEKAYELNETQHSVAKQSSFDIRNIVVIAFVFILLAIGYKRNKKEE